MQGRVLRLSLGVLPDKGGQAQKARAWVPQPHPVLLSGNEVSSLSHPAQPSLPPGRGPGRILAHFSRNNLSPSEEAERDPWLYPELRWRDRPRAFCAAEGKGWVVPLCAGGIRGSERLRNLPKSAQQ